MGAHDMPHHEPTWRDVSSARTRKFTQGFVGSLVKSFKPTAALAASVAEGFKPTAALAASVAEGFKPTAALAASVAEGFKPTATAYDMCTQVTGGRRFTREVSCATTVALRLSDHIVSPASLREGLDNPGSKAWRKYVRDYFRDLREHDKFKRSGLAKQNVGDAYALPRLHRYKATVPLMVILLKMCFDQGNKGIEVVTRRMLLLTILELELFTVTRGKPPENSPALSAPVLAGLSARAPRAPGATLGR